MKTSARNAPWEEEPIVWHRYSTNLAGGQPRGQLWLLDHTPKRFWSVRKRLRARPTKQQTVEKPGPHRRGMGEWLVLREWAHQKVVVRLVGAGSIGKRATSRSNSCPPDRTIIAGTLGRMQPRCHGSNDRARGLPRLSSEEIRTTEKTTT